MDDLRHEQFIRVQLRKKYFRAFSTIDKVTTVSSSVVVATGAGGIVLISTGVGALAGAVYSRAWQLLEAGSIACAFGHLAARRLGQQARKYDRISQTASAVLPTVHEITSRALN